MKIKIERHLSFGYRWSIIDAGTVQIDGYADTMPLAMRASVIANVDWIGHQWIYTSDGKIKYYGNGYVGKVKRLNELLEYVLCLDGSTVSRASSSRYNREAACDRAQRRHMRKAAIKA